MTQPNLATPIADLELSHRTSDLLRTLKVTTLGELLALPEIVIPTETPVKIASLMLAELRGVLAELGVEYPGAIIGPTPTEARLSADGDVVQRWHTIAAWLSDEHPRALAQFNPPATKEAIATVEKALGHTLPDDYKTFLLLANGQEESAPMVGLGALLPIETIAAVWNDMNVDHAAIDSARVGEGVRAVECSRNWIPISRSARGRDFLCLDLDPAPGGIRGQVIEYISDDDARPRIAPNFADLLSLYFVQAQQGDIDFSEIDDDADSNDS